MKRTFQFLTGILFMISSNAQHMKHAAKPPSEILGNPDYPAICYEGYRHQNRSDAPTVEELKEDVRILYALGMRVLRTYHARLNDHAPNLLQAITELKQEDENFEMYVMLGAWMQCERAFTEFANHTEGDEAENSAEIDQVVMLANKYPDIVKVIAVGNESMVHWAASYFVQPSEILKWVNRLQGMKKSGELPADIWITTSDNFASWGGGGAEYHTKDLTRLIKAVDYVSMHTYPFHDTHYNPQFWVDTVGDKNLTQRAKAEASMQRAAAYAKAQYKAVAGYLKKLGIQKHIHIGETGWASSSDGFYGPEGSQAATEYNQKLYYDAMRQWTNAEGISCFFFEAFDEPWKDSGNPEGSENHFGLFTVEGNAKYVLWHTVDAGTFRGLGRNNKAVGKTFGGDEKLLLEEILVPVRGK